VPINTSAPPKKSSYDVASDPKINMNSNDPNLYEVQKGDTLYSISKKFNLLVDDLKQKNNLTDNAISIGQRLRVK
jgi:LysM repeat protein